MAGFKAPPEAEPVHPGDEIPEWSGFRSRLCLISQHPSLEIGLPWALIPTSILQAAPVERQGSERLFQKSLDPPIGSSPTVARWMRWPP